MNGSPQFTISFFGAAETVTGSRYLVESAASRVLVDCGLFQGYKRLRQRNWAEPGFAAAAVDAVVLTHAHLDHSGYLPRLMNAGFQGPVYCTPGTRDLLRVLLPDAGHLQEEEAKLAAKLGYSKHRSPLPLFTRMDAERALELLEPRDLGQRFSVTPEVTGSFSRAGHIVGSACLLLQLPDTTVAFSGDVGRPRDSLLMPPAPLPACDNLVVESTYGDRLHSRQSTLEQLAKVVLETVGRGGALVIPAFAVGRAQHLLYLLSSLRRARTIPELPIFLDSPMAIDATAIFQAHAEEHALLADECRQMCATARYAKSAEESKAIDATDGPQVIISASGMATGGRVLHHLSRFLPDERNTVLIVGYQSSGTRGRALSDGAQELKIHGRYVPVRAHVEKIEGLSAHADYQELVDWLRSSDVRPGRVFVTHGEPAAADAMRRQLADRLGWQATVPEHGAQFPLFVPAR
jgi:metallo-beta-lactamase family protein